MRSPTPSREPDGKRRRSVRLRDIAELAGVHITTVSSVLSPKEGSHTRVSSKTAARIRDLAEQLRYRPDHHAQMMRKKKTGIIAVMGFGLSEIHAQRTFDLTHAIRDEGYYALTVNLLPHDNTSGSEGVKSAFDHVLSSRPEGIILMTPTIWVSPHQIYEIQDAGIPCVAFNGIAFPGIPQVRSDAASGAEALTRHLLGLGHRRLISMASWGTASRDEATCWPTLERFGGFRSAILQAGGQVVEGTGALKAIPRSSGITGAIVIPEEPKPLLLDTATGYQIARGILDSGERPDALVCSNDRYAIGAMRACFEAGLKIPDEIAITGFGGEKDAQFLWPSLTTVDTLASSSAEAALKLLLEIMRNERPIREGGLTKTPCELIIRESCGAAPGQRTPE